MVMIDRTNAAGIIPEEYHDDIIQEATYASVALSTFRKITIPTAVNHLPILNVLPIAGFTDGEAAEADPSKGKKPAASAEWGSLTMTAEEIAAVVPIPEAVLEDAVANDLWGDVTEMLGQAIGSVIDGACFFGTNAPASWPTGGIKGGAVSASQLVVPAAAGAPTPGEYSDAFAFVEADGYQVQAAYASVNQKAVFRGMNASGVPIYLTDVRTDGMVSSIYGVPVHYSPLAWEVGTQALVGDPDKAIIGVRKDLTFKLLDQASIDVSAAQDGSQMLHLAQQDSVALRVRARVGFVVANPVTPLEPTAADRYPFAAIAAS